MIPLWISLIGLLLAGVPYALAQDFTWETVGRNMSMSYVVVALTVGLTINQLRKAISERKGEGINDTPEIPVPDSAKSLSRLLWEGNLTRVVVNKQSFISVDFLLAEKAQYRQLITPNFTVVA